MIIIGRDILGIINTNGKKHKKMTGLLSYHNKHNYHNSIINSKIKKLNGKN